MTTPTDGPRHDTDSIIEAARLGVELTPLQLGELYSAPQADGGVHAGARGMMQLMPGTAREVAGKIGLSYDAGSLTTDTNYNFTLGSTYFQQMLSYFGGSYPLAVAAYNAGPGNVNKWLRANGDPRNGTIEMVDWIEAIPIFETRNYVQRVLENAVVYDTLRDRPLPSAPLSFYLGKRTPG